MTRHLVSIDSLNDTQLSLVYDLALAPIDDELLKGQGVALIFERPSLRTRAASSSAVYELGGYVTFFGDEEIGLDTRESAEDVGRTLAEMYAITAMRVRSHGVFERIANVTKGRLSLINLLSNVAHPTQAIADVLTIAEHYASGDVHGLSGLEVCYVGDATNVTRSLAVALLRLGVNVTVGAPLGYQLVPGGVEDPTAVVGAGVLRLVDNPVDAAKGADVIYTDAWVSMGFENETAQRRADLGPYRVDESLLTHAKPDAIVMHCLPAHRGDEITDQILDASRSKIWRQVYHRRSAMLGALRWIKKEKP